MAHCRNCNYECSNGADYCPNCGMPIVKVSSNIEEALIDKNEKVIQVFRNSAASSFVLNGRIQRTFAILTDRRYYVKGTLYSISNGFDCIEEQLTVNVEDITAVRYVHRDSLLLKILLYIGVIPVFFYSFFAIFNGRIEPALIPIVGYGVLVLLYFLCKKTFLCVCYPGGSAALKLNFGEKEVAFAFISNILLAKDNARKESFCQYKEHT